MTERCDKELLEVWKETRAVMQHFTDICFKIRNLAIITLGTIGSGFGFLAKDSHEGGPENILLLMGFVAWAGFFVMDKYWYHRMLKGAAAHCTEIEKSVATTFPLMGLTGAISAVSPITIGKWELRTNQKLALFYYAGFAIILAAMFWAHWPWFAGVLSGLLLVLWRQIRQ